MRKKARRNTLLILMCLIVFVLFSSIYSLYWTDQSTSNMVAYYQNSGQNKIASRFVLYMFRMAYPSAQLYIHFDSNKTTEKQALADEFGAVITTYSEKKEYHSTSTTGLYFALHASVQFIQRLQTAARLQPDGWVMLLEDDVWALDAVDPQAELSYDINGQCWLSFDKEHSNIIQQYSLARGVYADASCYGASGGSIINSSRLLGINTSDQHVLAFLQDMMARGGDIASDLLISSVILQYGGTIGPYSGYYDFVVVGHGIPKTIHKMKILYFLKYFYG
jgi:hypothetical protein